MDNDVTRIDRYMNISKLISTANYMSVDDDKTQSIRFIDYNGILCGGHLLDFNCLYSGFNGFQIFFYYFKFIDIYRGVLGGSIVGNQYSYENAFVIDMPMPYYIEGVGSVKISVSTGYLNFMALLIDPIAPLLNGFYALNLQQNNQEIEQLQMYRGVQLINQVNRKILLPQMSESYEYYLGDIALLISTASCSYYQECSDIKVTQTVTMKDGTSLITALFKYVSSSEVVLQPNQPPRFFSNPSNFTLITGSNLIMRLPDYYDPNPQDTVKLKVYPADQNLKNYFNSNPIMPMSNEYHLFVTFKSTVQKPPVQDEKAKYELQVQDGLKNTIKQSDQFSVFNLRFADPSIKFELQFVNATSKYMQLRIVFLNPLIISFSKILWGLVNTQQIITSMPLMTINPPSNLYYFFLLVGGSLRFDISQFNDLVINFFQLYGYFEPYNEDFFNFGYETKVFLLNVGINIVIIVFLPLIIGMGYLFKYLGNKFKRFIKFKDLMRRLARSMIYNFPLRLFIELYLNLILSSGINLTDIHLKQTPGTNFSSFLAIFSIIVPFASAYLFYKKPVIKALQKEKYHTILKDLRTDSIWSLMYYPLYFLRRLAFIFSIFVYEQQPHAQIIIYILSSIFQMIYLILVKPFETPKLNYIEILNETLVLFTAQIMIIFTDAFLDPYLRYDIGWFILSLITTVSIINMISLIAQLVTVAKRLFWRIRYAYYQCKKKERGVRLQPNSGANGTQTTVGFLSTQDLSNFRILGLEDSSHQLVKNQNYNRSNTQNKKSLNILNLEKKGGGQTRKDSAPEIQVTGPEQMNDEISQPQERQISYINKKQMKYLDDLIEEMKIDEIEESKFELTDDDEQIVDEVNFNNQREERLLSDLLSLTFVERNLYGKELNA
ncbi:UNKNOWN [Stylonychia lemnae]|uniref:TRP C-terminal domain-containing protein n=1 Tax=Stylonychia lemnae TaxID=5949 RepID=A0A078AKX6_STYLE|nr:UNKNOWN [Stylonychia lemnae]|eukprot:CDW82536.1 UNKNOWN [Stylonychia lemnae]